MRVVLARHDEQIKQLQGLARTAIGLLTGILIAAIAGVSLEVYRVFVLGERVIRG